MSDTLIDVKVTEFSNCGKGIGLVKDTNSQLVPCHIPFTVPGDYVKAKVTGQHDEYASATLQKVLIPSPIRMTPRCAHFGSCSGCTLQHVPYKGQLLHKEKILRTHFEDFITKGALIHPIIPCKATWNYRSSMDYSFVRSNTGKYILGLPEIGAERGVVSINECSITPHWFMDALISVKQWWEDSRILPYDETSHKGLLRQLTLREGRKTGDRMVILSTSGGTDAELSIRHIEKFTARVSDAAKPHQHDNQLSLVLRVYPEGNSDSHYEMALYGPGVLREGMRVVADQDKEPAILQLQLAPASKFYINPQQAEIFISKALQMASLKEDDTVYELRGEEMTLSLCIAKFAKTVVAVEPDKKAAEEGMANAQRNACNNLTVKTIEDVDGCPPDLLLMNDRAKTEEIRRIMPKKILYLSDNPAHQALLVKKLTALGYKLTDLLTSDSAPHTNLVDAAALLALQEC